VDVAGSVESATAELASTLEVWEVATSWGTALAFERPLDAVRMALAVQSKAIEHDGDARVVVHLTEILLARDGSGRVGAVPETVLAELVALARPRQTLLTRGVFDLARRAAVGEPELGEKLRWESYGLYELDALDEPFELFEVGEERLTLFLAPAGSDRARRVLSTSDWRAEPGAHLPSRPNWQLRHMLWETPAGAAWVAEHSKTGDTELFTLCEHPDRLPALQREVTLSRLLKEALGDRRDICRILDWSFEAVPYFTEWELPEGGSLREWAGAQGGVAEVPVAVRLELAAGIAEAVAAAHSVGVVHGSVSPDSVLVAFDRAGAPYPVVANFGGGRITDTEQLADHKITMLGALPEPSPEAEDAPSEAPEAMLSADVNDLGSLTRGLLAGDLDAGERDVLRGVADGNGLGGLIDDALAQPPRLDAAALAFQLRELTRLGRRERRDAARSEAVDDDASASGRSLRWLIVGGALVVLVVVGLVLLL
jgi:serine/threonine-protein kinase